MVFSLCCVSASAATTSVTYSTNSSSWSLKKTTNSTSYNNTGTLKYITTKNYYAGGTTTQEYKALTDCMKHYYGESKQTISSTVSKQYTFKGSGSGDIKSYTAGLGFIFSKNSATTVSDTISASVKSGWYYYGQRVKTQDEKLVQQKKTYKMNAKKTGWVLSSTGTANTSYATGMYKTTYLAWVYESPIKD